MEWLHAMVQGMSECDDYDSNDDGTPNQQDWIRGTYDFDLEDTSRITLSLSWAIREFDRSKVGLDDPLIQSALANDGLDVNDGIPADMIRSYFAYDDGSGTVGDRMLGEVQSTIQDLLASGFGTVNGINTQYDTSYHRRRSNISLARPMHQLTRYMELKEQVKTTCSILLCVSPQ